MCDISGFTGSGTIPIEKFGAVNAERGPDGTNYYKSPQLNVAHSLLSIQNNKEQIQQPYVDPRTGNVLAYNGEIYGLGDQFDTKWLSDVLNAGDWETLKYKTNGMWAFAFYDRSKQILTLCRDHFGVKPLYYAVFSGQLYFASTPKPLIMASNTLGYGAYINRYRTKQFELNDRFPFGRGYPIQGISRVAPGERVEFCMRTNKILGRNNLWGDFNVTPNYGWSIKELHDKVEKAIKEVCTAPGIKKTVSLSGGIDSSLIAGVAKKHDIEISATTLKFRKVKGTKSKPVNELMYGEWPIAKKTCEELDIPFNWSYYNEEKQATFDALSTPAWDINRTGPRYANIKKAASEGNKIYLVGDGADELCTGYSGDYQFMTQPELVGLSEKKMHKHKKIASSIRDVMDMPPPTLLFQEFIDMFPKWNKNLGDDAVNNQRFQRMIMHCDGFNTVADHICGSFGMESRVPFLHQELAKYIINIPGGVKLYTPDDDFLQENGYSSTRNEYLGQYKFILRDICKDMIPDHVRKRGRKTGFANPVDARDHQKNIQIGLKEFDDWIASIQDMEFDVD